MKIQIKNRFDGSVIFETDAQSVGDAVKIAITAKQALSDADLSGADLSEADLSCANLSEADLSCANLSGAVLRSADLRDADLSGADLRSAHLSGADLRDADLSGAVLRSADLSGADLRSADLRSADLRDADLSGADLRSADLSGCKNLPLPSAFLSQFKADADGILVYRAKSGLHDHPKHWEFKAGKFLTETPNPDRCTECGCGVNFGTKEFVSREYDAPFWLCRIRWADLADVVVPFNTDGKARCARLELIEKVEL